MSKRKKRGRAAPSEMGTIYVLCFDDLISPNHTTRHYLGWASNLEERIEQHRTGQGAKLTQAAYQRGISFELVRIIPGDRTFERKLKNQKNTPRLCPKCCKSVFLRDEAARNRRREERKKLRETPLISA